MKIFSKVVLPIVLVTSMLLSGCGGTPTETPVSTEAGATATSTAATSASAEEITLEFWHMLTGGDGKYLDEIVNKFNAENTMGITVKPTLLKTDELNQKLAASAQAQAGLPDVLFVDEKSASLFSETVLQPMDELLPEAGINMTDYNPLLNEVFSKDGKTYAIPVETFTWVLYYNKDLLTQLGYTEEDLKDLTLDEMKKMCEETMALGEDYYGLSLSGADDAVFERLFYTSIWQAGSNTFDPADPTKIMFNNEQGVKGAEAAISLGQYTVPNGTAGRPPFVAGKVLFHFNGVWEISQLDTPEVNAALNWGVVPFPQLFGDTKGVWAGAHGVGITNACDTKEKQLAALEFCKFVADNGLILSEAGHIPSKIELVQSDEFAQTRFAFFSENMDAFAIPPGGKTADAIYKTAVPVFKNLYWGEITGVQENFDKAASAAAELAAY